VDDVDLAQGQIIVAAHRLTEGVERVLTYETALSLARMAHDVAEALTALAPNLL
jgi:hypothetical protein